MESAAQTLRAGRTTRQSFPLFLILNTIILRVPSPFLVDPDSSTLWRQLKSCFSEAPLRSEPGEVKAVKKSGK